MGSGSELVEWLITNVEGLQDRKDARQYASNLLKAGYIRHTVNKTKFSEQCYYVFGEYNGAQIHKGKPPYVNIISLYQRFVEDRYIMFIFDIVQTMFWHPSL